MESGSFDKRANTHPIPIYVAATMDEGDEISLFDLWCVIARHKRIVLAGFLLPVLAALVYIWVAEPVYIAYSYLLPPQQQKVQGLLVAYRGVEGLNVSQYTPQSVYGVFLDNLESQGTRREFFGVNELIAHYASSESAKDANAGRVFYELFNKRLRVQIDKQNASFVTVSFADSDPKFAAQRLNQIINYSNKRTVDQLLSNLNVVIQSEIDRTRFQLDSKLKLAEQRRSDAIVSLREALRIARTLGIEDTSAFPKMADNNRSGLVVNTAEAPLYMRGSKALETEVSVLESRKSDEPFIDGFRDLQERQEFLENIVVDPNILSAVTVDATASIPYRAVKPRGALTLSLAAILGLVVGILGAFIKERLSRRQ